MNLSARQIAQIVGTKGFGINPMTIGSGMPSIRFPKDFYSGNTELILPTKDIVSISQEASGNQARQIKGRAWGDYLTDIMTQDGNNKTRSYVTNMPEMLLRKAMQMAEDNDGAQVIIKAFNDIRAIIKQSPSPTDVNLYSHYSPGFFRR